MKETAKASKPGRSRTSSNSGDNSKFWRIAGRLMKIATAMALMFTSSVIILLLYLRTQALPTATIPKTTEIYDSSGGLIDTLYKGQNRDIVPLGQISPYLVEATLSIEDHRFYKHFAFDFIGMARAAFVDLTHMSKAQGGSSITQQLAWNLYLTHEKTWQRKLKEAIYAVQLEMRYSKNEILQKYLNQIYYGHSLYGIEAAAQTYFGEKAAKLDLAESAMLAGVPKGPAFYSPYLNMKNAKSRQQTVLDAMVRFGYITRVQAEQAYREKLDLQPLKGDEPAKAPYFRDYVKQRAEQILGITDSQFEQGGYTVYTSLDLRAQRIAEDEVQKYVGSRKGLQAALVSIDPRTGYIKAMVGGKDYNQNQFNRVFATTRQPGSSFKGILYLTALEQPGFTASTLFRSEPTLFTYDHGRETYAPRNYGDEYTRKEMDLRTAIARSDNIFAVSTIMQIGPAKVIDTARKLGIETPMQPVPSLALGTFPVSPFEMASAYATIANSGIRIEPAAILSIVDANGSIVYETHPKVEQAADPAACYVLTNLLESIFEPGGTGFRVSRDLKRPVAAKTGTTDTDAWMVGFTPELATAVWVGYDRGKTINVIESHLASPIFAEYTERALADVPPQLFRIPPGVVGAYIDPQTGMLATPETPHPRLEYYIEGTEPMEYDPLQETPEPATTPKTKAKDEENRSWWEDLKRWWNS